MPVPSRQLHLVGTAIRVLYHLAGSKSAACLQGEDVEDEITRLQQLIFVQQGIDGAFGISCLGRVHATYSADEGFMQEFVKYVNRCGCLGAQTSGVELANA